MYDQLLERVSLALDGIPGIRSVLLGLEEQGDTPCIRIWIHSSQQTAQIQNRRCQQEIVSVCVQIDTFSSNNRRTGYLHSLRAVSQVKQRLERLRLAGLSGLPLATPSYSLVQMPESDAVVHVITCPFEGTVMPDGDIDFNLPPVEAI